MGSRSSSVGRRATWLRRLVCLAAILFIAAAARPAWQSYRYVDALRQARKVMRDQPEQALPHLLRAQQIQPGSAEPAYLLAVVHRRGGQLERVNGYLGQAERLGWPEADIARQRLLMDAQQGRVDDAIEQLKAILRAGTHDEAAEEIYEALTMGYMASFRLKDARDCLYHWIEWQPRHIRPRMWLADVWERIEDPDAAIREYRAILEFAPHYAEARWKLALALMGGTDVEATMRELELCLADGRDTPDVHIALARCERRLGLVTEAEQRLERVLQGDLQPRQEASALLERAELAMMRGENELAIDWLERALQLEPHGADMHYVLAQVLSKQGRRDDAKYHLEQYRVVQDRFSRLAKITRQLLNTPEDVDLRSEAGQLMVEQGMADEGAAWMITALQYDPLHQVTHERLAEYYENKGEKLAASRHRYLAVKAARAAEGSAQVTPVKSSPPAGSSEETGGAPDGRFSRITDSPSS